MDSFNLNSLVVIILQFTREESETREVSDLPKVTGLRAEEPHSAPAECALSVTQNEWIASPLVDIIFSCMTQMVMSLDFVSVLN